MFIIHKFRCAIFSLLSISSNLLFLFDPCIMYWCITNHTKSNGLKHQYFYLTVCVHSGVTVFRLCVFPKAAVILRTGEDLHPSLFMDFWTRFSFLQAIGQRLSSVSCDLGLSIELFATWQLAPSGRTCEGDRHGESECRRKEERKREGEGERRIRREEKRQQDGSHHLW